MSLHDISRLRLTPLLVNALTMACIVLLAVANNAQAGQAYPKAIKLAVTKGVEVVKIFPAASGLTGWILSQDGTYSVAYTTPDRKTVIIGTMLDEKGENLTDTYLEKYFPKPDRAALFKQLEQSTYIIEGEESHPKSILYAFVDSDCTNCQNLWIALQPYLKAGLQVRWIPVATHGTTSMSKAIEILDATDRAAAFRKMQGSSSKQWLPAQGFMESAKPEVAKKVRENSALMKKFDHANAPVIVWTDRKGKVQVKGGMPRLSELARITGLPEQEINDPRLAKFK